MVALPLLLVLHVALHLSEIRPLIMRRKVYHNLFVIACDLLLVLLHAALHYDVHEFIDLSFSIYDCACLVLLESRVLEDFPSLF